MDGCEVRHLPETENAGVEANDEKRRLGMERCADDLSARLIEVMSSGDTPPSVGDGMVDGGC